MNQKTAEAPSMSVAYVDNPHAPEFFAADAAGFMMGAGVIHFTYCTPRVNHEANPGPVSRVVNLRVVMTIPGAVALAAGLNAFLKQHGIDPAATS